MDIETSLAAVVQAVVSQEAGGQDREQPTTVLLCD